MYVREPPTETAYNTPQRTEETNYGPDVVKRIARIIFDRYDKDRDGFIDVSEAAAMMTDAYKAIKQVFTPSNMDLESYFKVIDRNGDGRVSLQDVEALVHHFLVGDTGVGKTISGRPSGSFFQNQTTGFSAGGQKEQTFSQTPGQQTRPGMSTSDRVQIEARTVFDRYDQNHTGFVNKSKAYQMLLDLYRQLNYSVARLDAQTVDQFLASSYDKNRDGRLSFPEFVNLFYDLMKYSPGTQNPTPFNQQQTDYLDPKDPYYLQRKTARLIFSQYDKDGNGFIDKEELWNMLNALYIELKMSFTRTRSDIKTFYDMFDQNQDGKLSREEFENLVIQLQPPTRR